MIDDLEFEKFYTVDRQVAVCHGRWLRAPAVGDTKGIVR